MQFVRGAIPELARGISDSLLLWAQTPPPCPVCQPVVHCDCPAVEPTQFREVFHERANPVEQTGLVLATFLTGLVAGHQLARGGLFGCQRRAPAAPVVSVPVPAPEAATQSEEEDIAELARRQQALIRKRVLPALHQ